VGGGLYKTTAKKVRLLLILFPRRRESLGYKMPMFRWRSGSPSHGVTYPLPRSMYYSLSIYCIGVNLQEYLYQKTVEDLPNADNNSYLWTYDLYVPYVILLMRATPLRGQVREGWALEIKTFLGPVKCHRAVRRVPLRAQKNRDFQPASKALRTGLYQSEVIDSFMYMSFCVLCSVFCILYSVFCIFYPVVCIQYSVFCILCSVFCVLCSVFCVLCSVFCVLCSVFCVLCSVFCIL
jgi:hypothetical protein